MYGLAGDRIIADGVIGGLATSAAVTPRCS
jgi:hypothetical protein